MRRGLSLPSLLLTTASTSIGKRLTTHAPRMSAVEPNHERLQRHLDAVDIGSTPFVELTRRGNDALGGGGGLAVLDSSFNPPTQAHMQILSVMAQRHDLKCSLLLLAKQNADKPVVGASLVQRLEMMELLADAAAPAGAMVCGVTAHPLFVDKASALRALLPDRGDATPERIMMLVGYDTWIRIVDPKYYGGAVGLEAALAHIFANVEVVVVSRDASSAGNLEPLTADEQEAAVHASLPESVTRARLHFMRNEEGVAAQSSSAVRGALAAETEEGGARGEGGSALPESVREMLPVCLHAYVEQQGLYR